MTFGSLATEAVTRLVLFAGAAVLLRTGTVTFENWQRETASTFEVAWGGWLAWVGLIAAAGIVVGIACLAEWPARYRPLVPLAVALPALLMLGHYVLVVETSGPGGGDLPSFLERPRFYMLAPTQFAVAAIAGFGLAGGLRSREERPEQRETEVSA